MTSSDTIRIPWEHLARRVQVDGLSTEPHMFNGIPIYITKKLLILSTITEKDDHTTFVKNTVGPPL